MLRCWGVDLRRPHETDVFVLGQQVQLTAPQV